MLKPISAKNLFWVCYGLMCLLQLIAATQFPLFGDEAFYWLESQYLAWSYTELPGWTQWTIALSQWLLPQSELTVRLPSLLAAFSIPWLGMLISKQLRTPDLDLPHSPWLIGLLLLALPLLSLAGVLAIPDIWLSFFALLTTYTLVKADQTQQARWFLLLGLVLALGVNVHVRFWMLVGLAGVIYLWQCRHRKSIIRGLLGISVPMMLLGFLPILWFNFQHDFPLLTFQFQERHPWTFQPSHAAFVLIQMLVTTPLLFLLCVQLSFKHLAGQSFSTFIARLAVAHWLLYAVLGFVTDELRFNSHWVLSSYVLILLLVTSTPNLNRRWLAACAGSGFLAAMAWLLTLLYWHHPSTAMTKLNAQFTENSRGWQALAAYTEEIKSAENLQPVTTDHFMNLAALEFYGDDDWQLKSLDHPMNSKHGRAKQLQLMQLMRNSNEESQLLVVEHSGMKLPQQIPFYQQACQSLNGLEWLDSLSLEQGLKVYYFFRSGTGQCQLPPIYYIEQQAGAVTGWLVHEKGSDTAVTLPSTNSIATLKTGALGNSELFRTVDPNSYQLSEFSISADSEVKVDQLQFQVNGVQVETLLWTD